MKRNEIRKLILHLIFIILANNLSFGQFKTTPKIEESFNGILTSDYTFIDNSFWANVKNGLAQVNNFETMFYKIDTNSSGSVLKYIISRDSLNIHSDLLFNLLQTNNNELWLIKNGLTNRVLKIMNDTIYNFKINDSIAHNFRSFYVGSDSIPWFHLSYILGKTDTTIHNVYNFNNNILQLKYTFKNRDFGTPIFFKLKEKSFIALEEYQNLKYYFSIYLIQKDNKELFYRVYDTNVNFSNFSYYIFNNEIYFLNQSGNLLKIDAKANSTFYELNSKKRYSPYNFFIVGDFFITQTSNKLIKFNLRNGIRTESEFLTIQESPEKCKNFIWNIFLSRDNYIYCSITSYKIIEGISKADGCENYNRLRIINADF